MEIVMPLKNSLKKSWNMGTYVIDAIGFGKKITNKGTSAKRKKKTPKNKYHLT
jgi:hypothetical protein